MCLNKNTFLCLWLATENKHINVFIMSDINTFVRFWWYQVFSLKHFIVFIMKNINTILCFWTGTGNTVDRAIFWRINVLECKKKNDFPFTF